MKKDEQHALEICNIILSTFHVVYDTQERERERVDVFTYIEFTFATTHTNITHQHFYVLSLLCLLCERYEACVEMSFRVN